MVTLASSSGKPKYIIKEYFLDTPSDIPDLIKLKSDAPGSKAKIISSGEVYIQNSQGQWILQPAAAGGGGEGGGGSPGVSIVGVEVDAANHLLCTMSNGAVIDAGEIKVQPGTSISLVEVDSRNHLIITLSDNTKIDAGLVPTVGVKTLTVDANNHLQVTLTNNTVIDAGEINTLAGDNAYSIAVKNGFSGTEQEWLESLKGEKGAAINSIVIDRDNQLICVLSDGTTINAGNLPNSEGLTQVTTFADLPNTGKTGMLYVTLDTGKIYYWDNKYKTASMKVEQTDLASGEEIDNLFVSDEGDLPEDSELATNEDIDNLFKDNGEIGGNLNLALEEDVDSLFY